MTALTALRPHPMWWSNENAWAGLTHLPRLAFQLTSWHHILSQAFILGHPNQNTCILKSHFPTWRYWPLTYDLGHATSNLRCYPGASLYQSSYTKQLSLRLRTDRQTDTTVMLHQSWDIVQAHPHAHASNGSAVRLRIDLDLGPLLMHQPVQLLTWELLSIRMAKMFPGCCNHHPDSGTASYRCIQIIIINCLLLPMHIPKLIVLVIYLKSWTPPTCLSQTFRPIEV